MPGFEDRKLQMMDLKGRFEARSSAEHAYTALAAVGQLKSEGATFWEKGSDPWCRWESGCSALGEFLHALGGRRSKTPDLAEVLREFIQEFEHATRRMYRALSGTSSDPYNDPEVHRMLGRFDLVYQLSTYAIVSSWMEDRTEGNALEAKAGRRAGEAATESAHEGMQAPRKYRRAAEPP